MKKLFGMLVAVLIVSCIAGSASATLFEHCDSEKWQISEKTSINSGELGKIISAISFKLETTREEKTSGSELCGFGSIYKSGNIDFSFCQPRPSCTPVPEPATMLLFGAGLVGFVVFRKKFKKE